MLAVVVLGLVVASYLVTRSDDAPVATARCVGAPPSAVEGINDGMTGGAQLQPGAVMVLTNTDEQNNRAWPKAIVGAKVAAPGASGAGTWAISDPATVNEGGTIMALNDTARTWSQWGAAARPGSQADENRSTIAGFEAAKAAEACADR